MKARFIAIHVRLLDEGIDVSRPTTAEKLESGLFKVLPTEDYDPSDETWEFPPGSVVKLEQVKGRLLAVKP